MKTHHCVGFIIDSDFKRVMAVREKRINKFTGKMRPLKSYLKAPGGTNRDILDETALETLKRKILKETGILVEKASLFLIEDVIDEHHSIYYYKILAWRNLKRSRRIYRTQTLTKDISSFFVSLRVFSKNLLPTQRIAFVKLVLWFAERSQEFLAKNKELVNRFRNEKELAEYLGEYYEYFNRKLSFLEKLKEFIKF